MRESGSIRDFYGRGGWTCGEGGEQDVERADIRIKRAVIKTEDVLRNTVSLLSQIEQ